MSLLQKAINLLKEKSIDYHVISLKNKAVTTEDVIKYGNVNPDEICKTIVIKTEDNRFYGLLLLGKDKIDFSKLKKVIGKAQLVDPEELKRETGMEPGTVCPLLLKFPVLVDKKVLNMEKINFGSGDEKHGIEISPKDLNKFSNIRIAEFSRN